MNEELKHAMASMGDYEILLYSWFLLIGFLFSAKWVFTVFFFLTRSLMKFRKKPVIIEAIRWEGNDLNLEEIAIWCDESWADESQLGKEGNIVIPTLEGRMEARVGDWIIKGVNGEFYPCKPDIFEKTYDKVE